MIDSQMLSIGRAGRSIRSFPVTGQTVEIGSHPACDITVHAARVPARALLIQWNQGAAYVYDLARFPGLRAPVPMPFDRPFELGDGYEVTRLRCGGTCGKRGRTEVMPDPAESWPALSVVSGSGASARVFRIDSVPLSVGGAADNSVTLHDRAVSRYHCRIEPGAKRVLVRDLDSTNGTWVDGVRVSRHELRPGTRLRLGRTDLRVVCRSSPSIERDGLVAAAPSMLAVLADVDRLAHLPWPVLVLGETGVGKEHVARALHDRGNRSDGPFVALNGGGLPRELIESELFGHEKGAFTGALRARRGAFERAHGGTLFLDEVAELPLDLQTRLLRVLETWEVRRVGGEAVRRVNVRLVCATHDDLRAAVRANRFRSDLFYRIHRFVVAVPPLRERREDIEPLCRHFLERIGAEIGARRLGDEAAARLCGYRWPGNVRELRNVLELAAVDCAAGEIDFTCVERALRRASDVAPPKPSTSLLREALEHYGGNYSAAARSLGIPRSTLRDRLAGESS